MFKRGDIVIPKKNNGYIFFGRVWRRLDENRVVIIDSGKKITVYHEEDIELSGYTGRWKWQHHPGNDYGNRPKWFKMTSLKRLKTLARDYNPHFGGLNNFGKAWSKEEKIQALLFND